MYKATTVYGIVSVHDVYIKLNEPDFKDCCFVLFCFFMSNCLFVLFHSRRMFQLRSCWYFYKSITSFLLLLVLVAVVGREFLHSQKAMACFSL